MAGGSIGVRCLNRWSVVGTVPATPSDRLTAAELLDRITATERAIAALQAEQARDWSSPTSGTPPTSPMGARTTWWVAASAPRSDGWVGQQAAAGRGRAGVDDGDDPRVAGPVGHRAGDLDRVRLVLKQTEALDEAELRVVDAQVADIVEAAAGEPVARLGQAALAAAASSVDPDAAAKRATTARSRRRVWLATWWTGSPHSVPCCAPRNHWRAGRCWTAPPAGCGSDGDDRSVQTLVADLFVDAAPPWSASPTDPAPAPGHATGRAEAGAEAGAELVRTPVRMPVCRLWCRGGGTCTGGNLDGHPTTTTGTGLLPAVPTRTTRCGTPTATRQPRPATRLRDERSGDAADGRNERMGR